MKTLAGGLLCAFGTLVILGVAGTSDYETSLGFRGVAHPAWLLFVLCAAGVAAVVIGFSLIGRRPQSERRWQ